MTIHITEKAAEQIKKQLAKRGKGLGLKLGVRQSGCSGFAYTIDYLDEAGKNDVGFEAFGVKVFVPEDDLPVLDGISLDYRREGLNEAFRFDNPNATGMCGCGESFTVN